MANRSGNAYALTLFCPILPGLTTADAEGELANQSHAACLQNHLEQLGLNEDSPLAKVPNTYLARFFILSDVFYEGKPAVYEHLKSQYLVFSSNFHGDLDPYLEGMWTGMNDEVHQIWSHCRGFDAVGGATSFIRYIKRCQVTTTFFFNGSTDKSQAEQLKALYLKQEFSKFVCASQGKGARELQAAFRKFVESARPADLSGPTWKPGASSLKDAVSGGQRT